MIDLLIDLFFGAKIHIFGQLTIVCPTKRKTKKSLTLVRCFSTRAVRMVVAKIRTFSNIASALKKKFGENTKKATQSGGFAVIHSVVISCS
ncbi:MAG: hypothetical protein IJ622_08895 [Bacteroidales bacterium]|nr:hypothetical protein [Bacteroidales bacterium]